ncbi:hypothetical protein EPIR_3120 [Erwinia piriflorinigrans CFBP 5888]|uniref:Uncharacterized protein n=1 Tax=Erwinia piriflorinigrans CFBP 5888 TaxID=1161919 RepID=V5ZAU8_9GAMM|nr:hypothetical protein EPIR_3120 [Erwinia piriflorinigrans CFBP 5888]
MPEADVFVGRQPASRQGKTRGELYQPHNKALRVQPVPEKNNNNQTPSKPEKLPYGSGLSPRRARC